MAYRGYEGRPPVVVTGTDDEPPHYTNAPGYQNFGSGMPEPWGSIPPRAATRPPTQDLDTQGYHVASNSASPFGQGSTARQSLYVATDVPPIINTDAWPRQIPGNLFQSPSSYLPPSPTVPGVPSVARHKVVDIIFDGANHVRLDLTRHINASAIRREILSRLPSSAGTASNFDIFRVHPPGPDAALDDRELMLDVEHFGDNRGTLKFLIRAADRDYDSHFPIYGREATTPSSLRPAGLISFPTPNPSPSSRNSTVDLGGWYGPRSSASDVGGYIYSPSQPLGGYSAHSPSNRVSMPVPMPLPALMQPITELEGSPGFPAPTYSTYHTTSPTFPTPLAGNSSGRPFDRRPVSMNSYRPSNMIGHSKHASVHSGRENLDGGIIGGGGEDWHRASGTSNRPHSVVITGTMTTDEVLSHLYERGCRDVTNELNESRVGRNPVARGGGGDVYSGELHNGERVALKCVRMAIGNDDPNKLKKTAHELYVWSKCSHPNVLELVGVTHYRDQVAMVSPWMENGDLRSFLRLYPGANRHSLCMQIIRGVAYLHSKEIVHGDIKGANVLISQDGVAKITDFGTSALKVYTLVFAATISKPGLSVRWAAPEILEEKSENSYHADVYALGMTILETITGDVPYAQITNECVVMRHIVERMLPMRPETHIFDDDILWSMLNQCWTHEYHKRPSALDLLHQMKSIVF